jgi:diguanylate cyclase (GGDEF)-like protein
VSESTVAPDSKREVNPTVPLALLAYVETALGPEGLERLLSKMPGKPRLGELSRTNRWWTVAEFTDLVIAGYEVTGDLDIGQRVGQQVFRDTLGGSIAELLAECGTAEVACAVMADYATRMEPTRAMRVIESSDSHVVIEGVFAESATPNPFSCGFTRGYFAALPSLFGNLGTVAEFECQARGAPACLFRVAWRPDPTRRADHQEAAEDRLVRGYSALEQLEAQHKMAARLVDAHEVDEVLERVVSHVSGTVAAPQYVLSVRLDDSHGRRVHHVGFEGDDAEILIDMLEAGELLGDECAVVKVRHGERVYGHLIAVFPPGASSSAVDQRFLRSYASYAASAIQIVDALSAAKRDRDTSNALLELAAALAAARDTATVAQKLCRAMPGASGCSIASVWLFDTADGLLKLADARDASGNPTLISDAAATLDLSAYLTRDGAFGVPFALSSTEVDDQLVPVIPAFASTEVVVVPIANGEQVIGVATAAFASSVSDGADADVMGRLQGLADQAVIAFENARLVEEMRHQALHDDLTGLPKRALAEDRCRLALSRRARSSEEVAVLFVDVDDFKSVNDNLGHAAGDLLLQQLANRLVGELRASDTCARVGGDEFVVIITSPDGPDAAEEVAERFMGALHEPFDLGGHSLQMSASIGIAWADGHDADFEELVRRADGAMYEAKANGKGQFSAAS